MPGSLLKFEKRYSVKIGGRRYPVVKIGNQLWMAENLDNEIGTLNSDYRVVDKDKYGLLYQGNSVYSGAVHTFLQAVPEGWHLPSVSELGALSEFCYTSGWNRPQCLKSSSDLWTVNNGTNDSGFSALPSGDYNGSIEHIGTYFHAWRADESFQYYIGENIFEYSRSGQVPGNYCLSIRLVKTIE